MVTNKWVTDKVDAANKVVKNNTVTNKKITNKPATNRGVR